MRSTTTAYSYTCKLETHAYNKKLRQFNEKPYTDRLGVKKNIHMQCLAEDLASFDTTQHLKVEH